MLEYNQKVTVYVAAITQVNIMHTSDGCTRMANETFHKPLVTLRMLSEHIIACLLHTTMAISFYT
jgi:hypothetical protein